MAAALPQFFGAARHPCFEVSDQLLSWHASSPVLTTISFRWSVRGSVSPVNVRFGINRYVIC